MSPTNPDAREEEVIPALEAADPSETTDGQAGGLPSDPAAAALAPEMGQGPAEIAGVGVPPAQQEEIAPAFEPAIETDGQAGEVPNEINAEAAESGEKGEASGIATPGDVPLPEAEARRALQQELLRERLHAQLDRSRRLPPGLKQRLLAQAEAAEAGADGGEVPRLRLSDAIAWLEQSLPEHVALVPDDASRPEHPRGEGFFRDDTSGLSDGEAEEIAKRQVARAGLARK